jgi:hypothetical protein
MQYINLLGRCEEIDEDEFETEDANGQRIVHKKWQFNLTLPTMRERLLCEIAAENAPALEQMQRWELEESWLLVGCSALRALGFTRKKVRPGEKAAGALVIFQASEIREATAEEKKQLQAARREQKKLAKARRAERKAEREAVRQADVTAQAKQSA